MKTFETEKHNIPEGATHQYKHLFGIEFYKLDKEGSWMYWNPNNYCWRYIPNNKPSFTPIPIPQASTETPEDKKWDGKGLPPVGAKCRYFVANIKDFPLKNHMRPMTCVAHVGGFDGLTNNGLAVLVSDDFSFSTVCNESWIQEFGNQQQREEKEALDVIDTTPQQSESVSSKEVEWVNGDECLCNGEEFKFVSYMCKPEEDYAVIWRSFSGVEVVYKTQISKPETPQQREEREREELADLACENLFGHSIQNCKPSVAATVRCMIDDGYRKVEK